MARRERRKLDGSADEERVTGDEQGVGSLAHQGREGRLDLARCTGVETEICSPMARAASRISRKVASADDALAGLTSTRNTNGLGHQLVQQCQPLGREFVGKKLIPVALPPGRARLVTRPSLTGSSLTPKTIGIVVVAALAASAAAARRGVAITATRGGRGRP